MKRKSTIKDVKSKLNLKTDTSLYWEGIKMENHYPIGYFVTEPMFHLKIV